MTLKQDLVLDFSNLSAYLQSVNSLINQALPTYLPAGKPEQYLYRLAGDYPARGGKRLRPALLWLSNACGGGKVADALPSAIALELFQNFALVHDDIEDSSLLRRGKPTLHRCYGIPLALNAGDLLHELAFEALIKNVPKLAPATSLDLLSLFCRLVRNTLEGQAMDIGWRDNHYFPTRADLQEMMLRKTGWYTGRGPCQMGVLIAQAGEELSQALGDYGECFGLGFQLCDDIFNLLYPNQDKAKGNLSLARDDYGKEHGGDFAEGKRTMVVLEMLERLDQAEAERLRNLLCLARTEKPVAEIEWAVEQAHRCGAIEAVKQEAQNLFERAIDALKPVKEQDGKKLLTDLVVNWQSKLASINCQI